MLELASWPRETDLTFADGSRGLGAFASDRVALLDTYRGVFALTSSVASMLAAQHSGAVRTAPATVAFTLAINQLTVTSTRGIDLTPLSDPTIFAEAFILLADTVGGAALEAVFVGAV